MIADGIDYGMNTAADCVATLERIAGIVGTPAPVADFDVIEVLADEVAVLLHPQDIIGPGEILELAQVGDRSLANWRNGKNLAGAGAFPAPIRRLKSGDLFDRRAVLAWLEKHAERKGT